MLFIHTKGYGNGNLTFESAKTAAKDKGLEILLPKSNELFIDLDSNADFNLFKELLEIFKQYEDVENHTFTNSSRPGHRHAIVRLNRTVTEFERIAFQAMLGSDRKREVLGYARIKSGEPHPTLFFEKPAAQTTKSGWVLQTWKATGHNCKTCNSRNDYATANQADGTYVCFECRT